MHGVWTSSVLLLLISMAQAQDAMARRIVAIGTKDPQVMTWLDVLTNRFGGRMAGSDAYTHAAHWAKEQFVQWGLKAELEEAGKMPVGFNRGPWFGRMVVPMDQPLRFGTPAYTSGTKGVQRGPAVLLGPATEAEVQGRMTEFKGAWVLIPGQSQGIGRDGRTAYRPKAVTLKLMEAGALGTIQLAPEPLASMEAFPTSWENLPTLPDIKLTAIQYADIQNRLKQNEKVELEFEIRNGFYPGPVPYANVLARIPGTDKPEEMVILGAHLDSYSGGTGAADNGAGFSTNMEAMRLLAKAGAKPRRTILMVGFAAEELGLLGASAFALRHARELDQTVIMLNRDSGPGAVTGITVPSSWKPVFDRVAGDLQGVHPIFGFEVRASDYPVKRPEVLSGSDAAVFSMKGVPTPRPDNMSDFDYPRAHHTLLDTYDEVVPFATAQEYAAMATALMAYEAANASEPLSREGYYLPDGLYAELETEAGNVMVALDPLAAPTQVARFVALAEAGFKTVTLKATTPPKASLRPPIGRVHGVGRTVTIALPGAWPQGELPKSDVKAFIASHQPLVGFDPMGVLALGTRRQTKLPNRFALVGRVFAGIQILENLGKDQELHRIRILRIGTQAKSFESEVLTIN